MNSSLESCKHGLSARTCGECKRSRLVVSKPWPFRFKHGDAAVGIVHSPDLGSRTCQCVTIAGRLATFQSVAEGSIVRMQWSSIPGATLVAWARGLWKGFDLFIPYAPIFLKTYPFRRCWSCHRPVGFRAKSLGCWVCGFSVCSHCGNCFSDFPGGNNVETGEFIPPKDKHVVSTPEQRAISSKLMQLIHHHVRTRDILREFQDGIPEWPRVRVIEVL